MLCLEDEGRHEIVRRTANAKYFLTDLIETQFASESASRIVYNVIVGRRQV